MSKAGSSLPSKASEVVVMGDHDAAQRKTGECGDPEGTLEGPSQGSQNRLPQWERGDLVPVVNATVKHLINSVRKETACLGSQFEGTVPHSGRAMTLGAQSSWSHCIHGQEAERDGHHW